MKNLITGFLLLLSLNVFAQKQLTLEDAVLKGRNTLAPQSLSQLAWIPNSGKFCYTANNKLVITEASSMKVDSLDVLKIMNVPRIPAIHWIDNHSFYYANKNDIWVFDISANTISKQNSWNEKAENQDVHQGTLNVAYTIDDNLFVSIKNAEKQVAKSDKEGIVYGKSVHREEFGIEKGTFWNNSGSKLAYYRMDQTMVTTYPIYDLEKKPAGANFIHYPMAGGISHHVTLMVYDVATDKSITIKTEGDPEQYLTNIAWSADDKYVFTAVLNRDQNHMQLNQYDATSGAFVKTLFEERSDKYVEPLHPMVFTTDGKNFIWQSQRGGLNNLFLYDLDGKLKMQLAPDLIALDFLGFDGTGKYAFISAVKKDSLSKITVRANLLNGSYFLLTKQTVNNLSLVSSAGDFIINQSSSLTLPRKYELINFAKNGATTILNSANPLADYNIGKVSIDKITTPDGTLLYTRTIYPYNFDSKKKYPMIVYVYGGPHVQLITNTWLAAGDLWFYYLANQGYIIYTVDSRGSGNRGLEFENAIFRNVGTIEMKDQMFGINQMKKQPFIDSTRVGVDGWSYGGFMTVSLFTRNPNQFKVAVAGGPVIDWSMYEVMYTERYMDTPEKNPDGYKNSSLFNYVDNINGKLMIIHGTSDNVVVWQHSLLYLKKCIEHGKQLDYFVYPGHEHNVVGPDRVHLIKKITDYFITNL